MTLAAGTRIVLPHCASFRILACATFVIAALLIAPPARAFDGARKGFILSVGVGGGAWSFDDVRGGKLPNVPASGLVTDFEIGGARNERTLVYYSNRVAWPSSESTMGVSGVGIRRYFSIDPSGAYFWDTTLGWSAWRGSFGSTLGLGASLGAGWEFRRHWLMRATALYGDASMRTDYVQPRGIAGTLSIQYLAY